MTLEFLLQVTFAGLMATYILLMMSLWAGKLGIPRLDFAKVMAKNTYGETFEGEEPPYFAGQALVYINGVFFALLYATATAQYLPGTPLIQGTLWGVILYFASCLFYVPLFLREGFFLSKVHKHAWITSAIVHGLYGLVLGWLCPILQAA